MLRVSTQDIDRLQTTLSNTRSFQCWMRIGNRFQDQEEFRAFSDLSSKADGAVRSLRTFRHYDAEEVGKYRVLVTLQVLAYSHILEDSEFRKVNDFCDSPQKVQQAVPAN